MTPEQISNAAAEIQKWFPPQTEAEVPIWRRALDMLVHAAVSAIPSGQVAEDVKTVETYAFESGSVLPYQKDVKAAITRIGTQAQSAENYRLMWIDEASAAKRYAKEAASANARVGELESGREALSEALHNQGQALATAEEEVRRLKPFEALSKKHEKALADVAAALDMYATAWRRELGSFYRPKRHEIDALVVSTRDMAEKAGEAEGLQKSLAAAQKDAAANAEEAERLRAKIAELEEAISGAGGWRDVLAVESALLKEEREKAARRSAAGQVLSEHGGRAAESSPEHADAATAEFLASVPRVVAKAPGWTMRDELANAAMQGLLTSANRHGMYQDTAERAYHMADAMLAARGHK